MRKWLCRCPEPTNEHLDTEAACAACNTIRPPSLDPLPDDQAQRFAGLIAWLDGQLAKRPSLLQTASGFGLSQLLSAAQRDPTGTYRTIASAAKAIGATVAWVERAEPAAPDAFDLLGPEE